jgi:hypothetical protein
MLNQCVFLNDYFEEMLKTFKFDFWVCFEIVICWQHEIQCTVFECRDRERCILLIDGYRS